MQNNISIQDKLAEAYKKLQELEDTFDHLNTLSKEMTDAYLERITKKRTKQTRYAYPTT